MRKIIYTMTVLAALGGTTAVSAEMGEATAQPSTAPAAPPAAAVEGDAAAAAEARTFTDAEVTQFAQATIAANEIQADTTIAADQKQAALVAAVEATGIDAPTYNAIVEGLQTDPTLEARISAEIDSQVGAPAAPAAPAQ